jgi:plastocyanin
VKKGIQITRYTLNDLINLKTHEVNLRGLIMKTLSIWVFQKRLATIWVIVLFTVAGTTHATTHVIQFGGSFGLTYSPNSLSISVGDTVEWEGDFITDPLSSTSVPTGAQKFYQGTGNVFTYPVTVAGSYQYQCDVNFSSGMVGSITVSSSTGIENGKSFFTPYVFNLKQNYPNPFNPSTSILFSVASRSFVSLKIYNVIGKEVATIVSEELSPGTYTRQWNANGFASGSYFCRLKAGSISEIKTLILLK